MPLLLLVPRGIGESVLRANWDAARSLLPPLLIALTGYASSFGALIGLRSLAAARRSLRAKCIDGTAHSRLRAGRCISRRRDGGGLGLCGDGCLRSLNAWWQFSRALREHEHGQQAARCDADSR